MQRYRILPMLALLALACGTTAVARAQVAASANYTLQATAVGNAGGSANSPAFSAVSATSQPGIIGTGASATFTVNHGFIASLIPLQDVIEGEGEGETIEGEGETTEGEGETAEGEGETTEGEGENAEGEGETTEGEGETIEGEGENAEGEGEALTLEDIAEQLYEQFDNADTNDDGRLSMEEATTVIEDLTPEQFDALDSNDDAYISREELEEFLGVDDRCGCCGRGCTRTEDPKRFLGDWLLVSLSLLALLAPTKATKQF